MSYFYEIGKPALPRNKHDKSFLKKKQKTKPNPWYIQTEASI